MRSCRAVALRPPARCENSPDECTRAVRALRNEHRRPETRRAAAAASPREIARDEAVVRRIVDLTRDAKLRDAAIAHQQRAVGEHERIVLIVRHAHDGQIRQTFVQRLQFATHGRMQIRIERGQRFVEQQHVRFDHERARYALLHAARQLRGHHVTSIGQLHELQRIRAARCPPPSACARADRRPRCRTRTDAETAHSSETAARDCADAAARASDRDPLHSLPASASAAIKPAMKRSSVVLPQPRRPSTVRNSPRRIVSDRSSSTVREPKRTVSRSMCTPGVLSDAERFFGNSAHVTTSA